MANETRLQGRLIAKHGLEVDWLKASEFTPLKGELVAYDIEVDSDGNILVDKDGNPKLPANRTIPYTYERFKIGDGIHNVNDLAFETPDSPYSLGYEESGSMSDDGHYVVGYFKYLLSEDHSHYILNGYSDKIDEIDILAGDERKVPLVILPYINGIPVTEIGGENVYGEPMYPSFNQLDARLSCIIIPDTVTTIHAYAFNSGDYECVIKSIYIPKSVTYIGETAFHVWSGSLTVLCGAESKPEAWDNDWNGTSHNTSSTTHEVIWNASRPGIYPELKEEIDDFRAAAVKQLDSFYWDINYLQSDVKTLSQNLEKLEEDLPPFIDVLELPTDNIKTDNFYRYTEYKEDFFAITGTRKDIVKKEYLGTEYELTVSINPVDTLPDYNNAAGITDFTSSLVLYYNRADGKVYGAINNLLLAAATSHSYGWYEPDVIIDNYAGVINNVLEAEDSKVYVIHEESAITHIAYYTDKWYELSADLVGQYESELGLASYKKFKEQPNKDTNVRAYRHVNLDYDRVYIESKGNTGLSGDYCLTPDIFSLPEDPWTEPQEGELKHLPSIPVRHADGGIDVRVDANSDPYRAISKIYFEENTEQYVRRKPAESSAVANANLLSAHTWSPATAPYADFANSFSDLTTIPAAESATSKDLVALFSESNANNSLIVDTIDDNKVLHCIHPTSAESHYRFIRQGARDELIFSTDLKIAPAAGKTNNRGFTLIAKNSITAPTNSSLWGGSNLTIEYPKNGSGYNLTYLSQTIPFNEYIGEWINLRIEIDSLKTGISRLYINNVLKISGTITVNLSSIQAYDCMIYNWNNSNSGFNGDIYFDNMYFGDIPDTIRYNGYDSLTPIVYDYQDPVVINLNQATIPLRELDGSILTKQFLTDSDDNRIATSKYYVDNTFIKQQLNVTYAELKDLRDNSKLLPGQTYRIIDYVCTTTQENTRAESNKFDIIVQAVSVNSLSETASADHHRVPKLKESILGSNKSLIENSVIPIYYEAIDYGTGTPVTEEYLHKDVFIAYDYLENNEGVLVPVLYKTAAIGIGQDGDPEYADPDYQDAFYYVGTEIIDSTTYDKWRKIDTGTDFELTWDSAGKIYFYTNQVVEEVKEKSSWNIPAWELKYSLDNNTSRFAWADAANGRGVIYFMCDEYNNKCPYDFKNIQFNIDIGNGDMYHVYTFFQSEDLSQERSYRSYNANINPWIDNNKQHLNFNVLDTLDTCLNNVLIENNCHHLSIDSVNEETSNIMICSNICDKHIHIPITLSPITYRAADTQEIILD